MLDHVTIRVADRSASERFYETVLRTLGMGVWQAGVDAGYRDNGAPGERSGYHPRYYAAHIVDRDGHNVEVVHDNR